MMKILIYSNCLEGHNLEYLHHLYTRAANDGNNYVFVVPIQFVEMKALMAWPESSNIIFDYITAEEAEKCNHNKYFHFLGTQTYSARLICRKIRKHKPEHTFLLSIDQGIPYTALFLRKSDKSRISCISYRILPYQWNSLPLYKKIIEWVAYHIVLCNSRYNTIFLLNNHKYLDWYNKKFKTDKYKYLTDPATTDVMKGGSLRDDLHIPEDALVYAHLGVLDASKGTVEILDAIKMLTEEEAKNRYFIFGGKVKDGIKKEFYKKVKALKSRNIIIYDKFCEYELFCSIYKTCDYVLFPYTPRPNSSGILGNAALFGKPVITTDGGAMGDLVREYHLGKLMPDNSPISIYKAITNTTIDDFNPRNYVEDHTIDNFCDQIFSAFN